MEGLRHAAVAIPATLADGSPGDPFVRGVGASLQIAWHLDRVQREAGSDPPSARLGGRPARSVSGSRVTPDELRARTPTTVSPDPRMHPGGPSRPT